MTNAIDKAPSCVASVTKRDKGIGVTKQYHFGYRVSKACQNHMPVKEWVLNGERIDEQESDALIDCHGFDILSDVSVLPALHAMPAMQLLSDALFKGYVEKEFLDAWARVVARAETNEDLTRAIELMEATGGAQMG